MVVSSTTGFLGSRLRGSGELFRIKLLVSPRSATALMIAALTAGCAGLHWHKSGVGSATHDQDLEQCRQDARLQAGHALLLALTSPLVVGADPQGRPIVVQSHQRDAERLMLQQDLTRACMRGKGYELVPQQGK